MNFIPVVHDPRNPDCPRNKDSRQPCRCTSKTARAWIPDEGIDETELEADK